MKTILFIEDEMSLQKSLASRLKDEGFEMISALDGEIGLRQAREKMPDLIILDLVLPKKDGFEALKELKSDAGLAPIPVIVLTNLEGSQEKSNNLKRFFRIPGWFQPKRLKKRRKKPRIQKKESEMF
ncbi:MAG: Two component transcriptional regulator, winged helix family [Parcubacteria group bacterium GW2011_GWA2_42_35]|nr:MAG: Two component transcriptional regulator, winged helix family [Parcubacteria group bacterium GW2011_GWA2_42_35]